MFRFTEMSASLPAPVAPLVKWKEALGALPDAIPSREPTDWVALLNVSDPAP